MGVAGRIGSVTKVSYGPDPALPLIAPESPLSSDDRNNVQVVLNDINLVEAEALNSPFVSRQQSETRGAMTGWFAAQAQALLDGKPSAFRSSDQLIGSWRSYKSQQGLSPFLLVDLRNL